MKLILANDSRNILKYYSSSYSKPLYYCLILENQIELEYIRKEWVGLLHDTAVKSAMGNRIRHENGI